MAMTSSKGIGLIFGGCVALAGCQSAPPAIFVDNEDAARPLPAGTPIAVDLRPLALAGFEFSPDKREQLEKERAERIREDAATTLPSPDALANAPVEATAAAARGDPRGLICFVPPIILVCAGGVAITAGVLYTGRRSWDSVTTPTLVPAAEGAAYAAVFRDRATGDALAARVARFAGNAADPASQAYPRLLVGLTSAQLVSYETAYESAHKAAPTATTVATFAGLGLVGGFAAPIIGGPRSVHISISASAKAVLAPGVESTATEHAAEFVFPAGDEEIRRGLNGALDILALSIVSTYFPEQPAAREFKEWQSLRSNTDLEALQDFIRRHPDGNLGQAARDRIHALGYWGR